MPSFSAFADAVPVALALLCTRLLLAGVFGFAGFAKLLNPTGSRQGLVAFGVPPIFVPPLGLLLPVCELLVAICLLPTRTVFWGAAGALALLLTFIAAMTLNLVRGRTPDCQCFAQMRARPIGWRTVLRNVLLTVLAALNLSLAGTAGRVQLWAWFVDDVFRVQSSLLILSLANLALLSLALFLVLHLFRQHGRVLLRMDRLEQQLVLGRPFAAPGAPLPAAHGLAPGERAPAFEAFTLARTKVGLEALLAGYRAMVMIFTDPNCQPCVALWPEIARWQRDAVGRVRLVVVTKSVGQPNARLPELDGMRDVLVQNEHELAELYAVQGTPGAVLIRGDGTIGSRVAMGAAAIATLVTDALEVDAVGAA